MRVQIFRISFLFPSYLHFSFLFFARNKLEDGSQCKISLWKDGISSWDATPHLAIVYIGKVLAKRKRKIYKESEGKGCMEKEIDREKRRSTYRIYRGTCNVLFFPPIFPTLHSHSPLLADFQGEFWWNQPSRKRAARRSVKSNPADVATNWTKSYFSSKKSTYNQTFSSYSTFWCFLRNIVKFIESATLFYYAELIKRNRLYWKQILDTFTKKVQLTIDVSRVKEYFIL